MARTKSIEQSIRDTDEPRSRLRKNLTTWDLTVFGISVLVGTGIFTLTARAAGDIAGPSISVAFVMAAVACLFAALCYAEFASTVPVAGSAYTFSYATFGEFAAWIIGWDLVLEFALASGVLSKGWSSYLSDLLGELTGSSVSTSFDMGPLQFDWGALLIVVVLATLLALGTKLSSRVNQVITVIKIGIVLLVIVAGLAFISPGNYSPFIPPAQGGGSSGGGVSQSLFSAITGAGGSTFGFYGTLAAASLVFFAYIGFDVVATTAEETKNPQKSIPRGILGSLGIVTVLYVAVALVVSGMVPHGDLATSAGNGKRKTLATAFSIHGVDWAATVIAAGALIGLTTVAMILMLGQIRVLFAMSRDGLMPRGLSKTGSRGTPVRATVLVGFLIAIAATLFPADELEEMVNVGTLFAFVLVAGGVWMLRRTRPDLPRAFRTPLVPLVPILAIVCCLWLMLNLEVLTWIRFVIWMAIGVIVYFGYGRRHSLLGKRQAAGEEEPEAPAQADQS